MLPGLIDKFSSGGKLYGVTWNSDTRFLMYNKAMLEKGGVAAPPKTWKELVEVSKKLQEQGIAKYGYIDSYLQAQSGANEFTYVVYSFGGKLVDDKGNPVMGTDPNTKAAYEFLVSALNDDKIVDPGSLTSDYETAADVFFMGNTVMFLQAWPGIYADANNPEVSNIVGQIAVADHVLSDGSNQVVLTLPEAMAIPKTSKNKEAAWKYIEYMTSREFDKEKAVAIGALPVWSELYNDQELLAMYPYWEQFGKQSEFARGLPDLLWYDELSNIMVVESQKILLKRISVEDGLKSMQEQCEKAMQ
jgi:multiple sugar transport system substrate-binding protein